MFRGTCVPSRRLGSYLSDPRSLGKPGHQRTVQGIMYRYGGRLAQVKGGASRSLPTILVKDIATKDKKYGTDHLWLDYKAEFGKLRRGDIIEFTGIVCEYTNKSPFGGLRYNLGLSNIRDLKVVGHINLEGDNTNA